MNGQPSAGCPLLLPLFINLRRHRLLRRHLHRRQPSASRPASLSCLASRTSPDQAESAQIALSPSRLDFNNAFERSQRKSVRGVMKGQGYSSAVGMVVVTVAAFLPLKLESILAKSGSQTTSGNRSQAGIIDAHTLTATTGSLTSVIPAGNTSPSSIIDSITICATS